MSLSTQGGTHTTGSREGPYLAEVEAALPRLLACFDTDPLSPAFGVGDRLHWAWKLIDFGNATFQGAAHGLARLAATGLAPDWLPPARIAERIAEMTDGTCRLLAADGSLGEALPNEGSFCVTALVANDLIAAADLKEAPVDAALRTRILDVAAPMVRFLVTHDETHGLISNHLATAALALYRWHLATGEPVDRRGRMLLDRILDHQSDEGWFSEYGGADPGYQTLCTSYLAALHLVRPDLGLEEPLGRSIAFLCHFAHPDGSFGGLYGSRNTRVYYPAGIEALAGAHPEAAALAAHMRAGVAARRTVTLAAMDPPNLVPMFNDYVWAAELAGSTADREAGDPPALPFGAPAFRRVFSEAGLLIDRGVTHYTILALRKGGVCYHFVTKPAAGRPSSEVVSCRIDAGPVVEDPRGRLLQAQIPDDTASWADDGDCIRIPLVFRPIANRLPRPRDFIVLRLLAMTVFHSGVLRERVKRMLVRLLIRGRRRGLWGGWRHVRLGAELTVDDRLEGAVAAMTRRDPKRPFAAIHMASQGYWQQGDDAP